MCLCVCTVNLFVVVFLCQPCLGGLHGHHSHVCRCRPLLFRPLCLAPIIPTRLRWAGLTTAAVGTCMAAKAPCCLVAGTDSPTQRWASVWVPSTWKLVSTTAGGFTTSSWFHIPVEDQKCLFPSPLPPIMWRSDHWPFTESFTCPFTDKSKKSDFSQPQNLSSHSFSLGNRRILTFFLFLSGSFFGVMLIHFLKRDKLIYHKHPLYFPDYMLNQWISHICQKMLQFHQSVSHNNFF